jgi:hypothetical protein
VGAARRAARVGDGWFPARGGLAELPPLIAAMHDECRKVGRRPEELEVTAIGQNLDSDTVKRFEDIGVGRLVIPPMAFDAEGLEKGLSEFAERLIARD